MSSIEPTSSFALSVATERATVQQRRSAFAVVVTILIALAALIPYAHIQLAQLDSFIPTAQIAVFITGMISAVLLFGQFSIIGSTGLLVLAGGYLFVALIVVAHILTFPGAFGPAPLLGAGGQSAGWLHFFWHLGFPTAIVGYVLLPEAHTRSGHLAFRAILWTVALVIGLVCLLTWIAIAGESFLPTLFFSGGRFSAFAFYTLGTDILMSAVALALLMTRCRSTLCMWLAVTSCAFLGDLLINAALISSRFTVGWYAARVFAILVSTIVMVVMLAETFSLNARLMRATLLLQRERENKLANLDAVVASIAHEVRQPLTAIAAHGAAARRYLDRSPPNVGEASKNIEGMIKSVMRGNEIFDSVRALFSNATQKIQPVDVNRLIAEVLDLEHERLSAERIATDLQLDRKLDLIEANKGQLREVLINLIQNAIDAMKTASTKRNTLRIKTGRHGNEAILISVEDTGSGIAPEKINNIFEPFFSTKTSGMGLGLPICKLIVQRHHGQLSASSEMGIGTQFQLILPVKQETKPAEAKAA
jgi:signal transduction histidine kinase